LRIHVDVVAITPDSASSSPVRALLWSTVAPAELAPLMRRAPDLPWVSLMTVTTGQSNLFTIVNLKTRAELSEIHAELVDLCPSIRMQETQLSTRAVKVHMRWLTRADRWTDRVADPFWALRDELARV
jgi:hypothetical protein